MNQINAMRQALEDAEAIQRYGLDTLSGRDDGVDDRDWQRKGVNEMTRRARVLATSLRQAIEQAEQSTSVCQTCNGRGVLSGHASDGSWDDTPCPDCSPTAPAQPDMTHCANEWADATMSALDGLRNVRDGVSTPDQVIAILKANIEHCRGCTAPVQPAECKDGCPPLQVCDYCQGNGGKDKAPAQQPLTVQEIGEFVGTRNYGEIELKWFRLGEAAHGIKGASL